MRKRGILAALGMAAVLMAGSAFPSWAISLAPQRVWGPVTKQTETSMLLSNQDPNSYQGDMILNISEETRILDAQSGMPVSWDTIQNGQTVQAYAGPAMTASIPPQGSAELILTGLSEEKKTPDYIEIKTLDRIRDGYQITSTDDLVFKVKFDCPINPYLTRNMLYLENLYEGAKCLVWSDGESTATQIMMFAPYGPEQE